MWSGGNKLSEEAENRVTRASRLRVFGIQLADNRDSLMVPGQGSPWVLLLLVGGKFSKANKKSENRGAQRSTSVAKAST